MARGKDKIEKLLRAVDELQGAESEGQLAARRAERALNEEREKALRLERELEALKGAGLKGLNGTMRRGSNAVWGPANSIDEVIDVPQRKSSVGRQMSLSKGFL